jgi:hypothetical protein
MTETNTRIRLATTAIAAALAIAAAPLPAQEASPPPDTSVDTPATPPSMDPLAPEPTEPSVTPETVAAPEAAPAAKASPTVRAKAATARKTATSSRPAPSPRNEPAAAAAPAPAAVEAEPIAAAPVAEPAPTETPAAPAVEPSAARQMQTSTVLPVLGAALIGLLAIIAAAFAIRRRRRIRREEYEDNGVYEAVAPVPAMTIEPTPEPGFAAGSTAATLAAGPSHDPIPNVPTTALPKGFDLSRFGRHTQAAYRGPTADNPSLSLKYRLRRAAALDQFERANRAQPAGESAAVRAAAARAEIAPAGGDFMLSKGGTKATVRRAYSE